MKKWLFGLACVGMMAVSAWGDLTTPATLPTEYAGASGWSNATLDAMTGWDATGLGTPYAAPNASAKMDTAGDNIVIYFNGAPGEIVYSIRRSDTAAMTNAFEAKVQESANTNSWTDVRTFNGSELNGTLAIFTNALASASRYVRFVYVTKATGQNFGLGYVKITSGGAAVYGVTFDQASGFTMEEGTTDAIQATAANGVAPYTYAWSSTLGGTHYATNGNEFSILATAPTGSYSATVVATDNTAQRVTNSLNFSVVAAAIQHGITITAPVNGTVTTTPATAAAEGVTVTVNATPAGGYRVASIAVLDATNGTVAVTGGTFTMPGSDVTVTVLFEVAPASSILISQYTETDTGSIPKGIEVWNVSGADITFDGTSHLLDVKVGSGGGAPVSVVTANSGTLAAGAVWVIGTTNMDPDVVEAFQFNGDDAVVLELGGVVQDMIGTADVDPGSAWSGNGVSTANQNIQVKAGITTGDADGWSDPSERFEYVAIGSDLTGFGVAPGGSAVFGVTVDRTNGFVVAQGASAAIVATAANGTAPYTYGWTSTLGGTHFLADTNLFTILGTAPAGDYSATVVATDAGAQSVTNIVTFSVVAPYAITITPPANGTVTTTPTNAAIAGATVTIAATAAGGYRVASIAVVDGGSNPVGLSGNTFVMPASAVTVTVLFELYDAPDVLLDFETNSSLSASTYNAGTSTVNNVSFAHQRVLRGNAANDRLHGVYAGRFYPVTGTNAFLTTTAAFAEPITKINFWHANYGSENGTTFKVQVSPDGATWTDVGAVIDPESTNLTEVVLESIPAGATYLQIVSVSGLTRVNIDDIGLWFGAPALTVTVDRTNGFTVTEGASSSIFATAANGTAPYTYGWSSTLGGIHFTADTNRFTILGTAPVGDYSATVVATDGGGQSATNIVTFSVTSAALPPADIGNITFLPASGNFTFVLPAGYTTPVNVYGADAALSGQSWVFSNLVEGVDYTRVDDLVTILTQDGKRQIIRIGVTSSPD